MSGPTAAIARVRSAVRAELSGLPADALVLVGVSGGQDSLALAAGVAFEGPRHGLRIGAVVVDHALQPDSATVADQVAAVLRGLGYPLVEVVQVTAAGDGGPEAAARRARYAALTQVADRFQAAQVQLGHTLDDQAETVVLRLARGSGARSLAGIPRRRGRLVRPLLGLSRATTAQACVDAGLEPWADPHNIDPAYARVRVREAVMPVLEAQIGPGIADSLARTAHLLRDDDDALEVWAGDLMSAAAGDASTPGLDCEVLLAAPVAVRRRVLRHAALAAGASGGSLRHGHLTALDALVADWHGQGAVDLPGGVRAERECDRLGFSRSGSRTGSHRSSAEVKE